MEMHQIRYFLAVCETLNFTRAAEQCHVTQPALTRAIQKLEEELGGLLFRRERHLTHLTDLGRLLRPQLEQVWKRTEAAVSRYKRVIGDALRSRTDRRQATEAAIAVRALNRMLELGRPQSVRIA